MLQSLVNWTMNTLKANRVVKTAHVAFEGLQLATMLSVIACSGWMNGLPCEKHFSALHRNSIGHRDHLHEFQLYSPSLSFSSTLP